MADTNGVTELGKLVDKYIFKFKLPDDDYFLYLQHACDCYGEISRKHSNAINTVKISVSSLGIIEMPSDMAGFGSLFIPIDGQWWSFTKRTRKVTTTTLVDAVETQDATMGEGVNILKEKYWGYGGVGGVNDYNINIDWKARRIFCDNFKSDVAVIQYTSSGLVIGDSTYVPQECEQTMDAYMNWKKEMIAPRSISMLSLLKDYYDTELRKLRIFNFIPSKDEICDAWDSASTQSVTR